MAVLRLHAGPALRPRDERTILLAEENVCAPEQYVSHSTKQVLTTFRGLRIREVRRIPLPRTPVNGTAKAVYAVHISDYFRAT